MYGELIPIVLFVMIGLVAIIRPLTKQLGRRLEQDRAQPRAGADPQLARLTQLMEQMVDRMDRLEDRVDFAERLLESRKAPSSAGDVPLEADRATEPAERRRRDRLSSR